MTGTPQSVDPARRTMVLGAAVGYTVDQIAPFLGSLRRTGYAGQVALLVDRGLEEEIARVLAPAGVVLLRARRGVTPAHRREHAPRWRRRAWRGVERTGWALLRGVRRLPLPARRKLDLQIELAIRLRPAMESRFPHFYTFLRDSTFERILLTDVRDVIFQADPFRHLPASGLAVSIESRRYTIATESHNAAWMARTYGAEALAALGERPVSCVGVTYGDRPAMERYLRLMAEALLALPLAAIGDAGADTAVHNWLLWTGRLGTVSLLETLASPVATLNEINESTIALDTEGRVLNHDGSLVSVLHQYDRLPGLRGRLPATMGAPAQ